MGVRILHDQNQDKACLYDSTTGEAFGPVMDDTDPSEVHDFLELLDDDPRTITQDELGRAWEVWVETRRR
jgi:hypothetical protein